MRAITNIIEVITHGGKKTSFTKRDIREMIDDIDTYMCADNLPGWIYRSGMYNAGRRRPIESYPKKKAAVLRLLEEMIRSVKQVRLNLDSNTIRY